MLSSEAMVSIILFILWLQISFIMLYIDVMLAVSLSAFLPLACYNYILKATPRLPANRNQAILTHMNETQKLFSYLILKNIQIILWNQGLPIKPFVGIRGCVFKMCDANLNCFHTLYFWLWVSS